MIKIKLKEIMRHKGLSITEVSNDTGISRSTLTPLVNNPETVKGMKFETIDKLCSYFDIDLQDLLEFTHEELKNKVTNVWSSKNTDDDSIFGLIELKRSNIHNEKFGYISFYLKKHVEITTGLTTDLDELVEVDGSYKCSFEIMNSDEILSLNTKIGAFDLLGQIQSVDQTEFKRTIEKMDRKELLHLTGYMIMVFMREKFIPVTFELIELQWSIGSIILDTIKNTFRFRNDYENKLLKNESDFEQLYGKEYDNYIFTDTFIK